jgi:hypothetical protein
MTEELLATIERLYGEAIRGPMAREFLDRMRWLPKLLAELDQGRMPFDASSIREAAPSFSPPRTSRFRS